MGSLSRFPQTFISWITNITRWMAQVGVAILALIVGYEVFVRYVLDKPTGWSVDYASLISVMIAYLGCIYVTDIEGHVAATILVEHFSAKKQRSFSILTNIFAALLTGLIAWQLWGLGMRSMERGLKTIDMGIPIYPFMIAVSICLILVTIQFLLKAYQNAQTALSKTAPSKTDLIKKEISSFHKDLGDI